MYVEEAGTNRLSKSVNRKIETANGEEVRSVTSKSINSRSSNRTNDKSNNNSVNNQENEIIMTRSSNRSNNEVDETMLNNEEFNNTDYEDITINNNDTLEDISMSNKSENDEHFDNEIHVPSITEDEDNVLDILAEEEEAPLVDNIMIALDNIAAKTILNDVELDTVATYLYSGNSLSALCKASLAIEDPVLSNEVSERESDLFFSSNTQSPFSYNDFETSSLRSNDTISKVTVAVGADHPLQHPVINKDKGQECEEMLLVLKSKGITAFLADVLIKPRRAIAKHTLSWTSWENVLELIKQGLKHDFDTLLNWR